MDGASHVTCRLGDLAREARQCLFGTVLGHDLLAQRRTPLASDGLRRNGPSHGRSTSHDCESLGQSLGRAGDPAAHRCDASCAHLSCLSVSLSTCVGDSRRASATTECACVSRVSKTTSDTFKPPPGVKYWGPRQHAPSQIPPARTRIGRSGRC